MTREETVQILFRLQCAYPLFYSNKTQKDFSSVARVWHEHIGGYDAEIIDRAAGLMIDSETEVPTIALLKRYIPKAKEQIRREAAISPEEIERLRRLAR